MGKIKRGKIFEDMLKNNDLGKMTISFRVPDEEQYFNSIILEEAIVIWKFFNEEVQVGDDPDPEQEPKKKAPKKKKDNWQENKLSKIKDVGKLIALVKAGWNKDEIAKEFGVTTPTVYNYINKLKNTGEL
ncbi:helix-turn-helix domain-containing protein [bacterium]|nr:helix-turn-helix domain-containing protein [bacterium]